MAGKTADQIIAEVQRFHVKAHVGFAVELFDRMRTDALTVGREYGSPVESGRFSASMNASVGKPDERTVKADKDHVRGEPRSIPLPALDKKVARLARFKVGQKIFITDAVPYSELLEFKGGSKRKTPTGIMGTTIGRWLPRMRANAIALAQRARIAGLT